jgi:hypothetical protein
MLPTQPITPTRKNPKKLLIFSQPKVGKTESALKLPNCFLIDLDDSADFYGGLFLNVQKLANEKRISLADAYYLVVTELKKAVAANNNNPVYDYIAVDTTTQLEEIAKEVALIMYKNTPIGKNFTGNDVLTLPNGAGEGYFRAAFERLYSALDGCYSKALILLGHVKSASIQKNGQDLAARDINLRGKNKLIVSSQMDAIGYLYRDKGTNNNVISFKTNEQDLATGSRCPHLSGQEFILSTQNPDKTLTTYWDKIFLK